MQNMRQGAIFGTMHCNGSAAKIALQRRRGSPHARLQTPTLDRVNDPPALYFLLFLSQLEHSLSRIVVLIHLCSIADLASSTNQIAPRRARPMGSEEGGGLAFIKEFIQRETTGVFMAQPSP